MKLRHCVPAYYYSTARLSDIFSETFRHFEIYAFSAVRDGTLNQNIWPTQTMRKITWKHNFRGEAMG
jgi:hypothetical protein